MFIIYFLTYLIKSDYKERDPIHQTALVNSSFVPIVFRQSDRRGTRIPETQYGVT